MAGTAPSGGMRGRMGIMGMGTMPMRPSGGMGSVNGGGQGSGMMGGTGTGMMGGGSGMMGGMGMMGMGAGSTAPGGTAAMNIPSSLPGFPGASHLYHIGATDFFLDQAGLINLTVEQQTALNRIKEKLPFEQADLERKLADAEQDLWQLTSADRPDQAKIESRIRSIEKLHADGRLAYIRGVGEAAKVLTDPQRQVLAGTAQPTMPMSPSAGIPSGGMQDDTMPGMSSSGGMTPAPIQCRRVAGWAICSCRTRFDPADGLCPFSAVRLPSLDKKEPSHAMAGSRVNAIAGREHTAGGWR